MLVRAVGLTSEAIVSLAAAGPRPRRGGPATPRWLLLTADGGTRATVVAAVRRSGTVCHAAFGGAVPARAIAGRPYQFGFIDMLHPIGSVAEVEAWADGLQFYGCRLVVRGHDGEADDELWARQRGAVLFLPGALDGGGFEGVVRDLVGMTANGPRNPQGTGLG